MGPEGRLAFQRQASVLADAVESGHIRRCTFRRVTIVRRGGATLYAVDCLYPGRQVPIPLGDLAVARAVCDACVAAKVFRPDEE